MADQKRAIRRGVRVMFATRAAGLPYELAVFLAARAMKDAGLTGPLSRALTAMEREFLRQDARRPNTRK